MHGKFLWYDTMTSDVAAAARFYKDVVGFGVVDGGSPDMAYTVLTVEGQGVAGVMPTPPDMTGEAARPKWFVYVAVDDVDQAVVDIAAAGGQVLKPPHTVPGVIRFAVVSDPQGAVFLVARGLRDEPMPDIAPRTPGTIGWRELYTSDLDAGFAFYETVFGWTKAEAHDMGPMGLYQLFNTPGAAEPVGGMMTRPPNIPFSCWGMYFAVEAIEAAAARIKAGGGQVVMGPHQVPGGDWIVQAIDPFGAFFALTSMVK